jgi:hypothetical protein
MVDFAIFRARVSVACGHLFHITASLAGVLWRGRDVAEAFLLAAVSARHVTRQPFTPIRGDTVNVAWLRVALAVILLSSARGSIVLRACFDETTAYLVPSTTLLRALAFDVVKTKRAPWAHYTRNWAGHIGVA